MHAFTSPGSYTVSVTSADQSGLTSSAVTQGLTIMSYQMQNDSAGVGGMIGLALSEPTSAQGIVLSPSGKGYGMTVTQNGISLGTFTPTDGPVAIYGDGGTDLVTINGLNSSANTFTLSGSTATFNASAWAPRSSPSGSTTSAA